MISWPAAIGMRWVKPSSATDIDDRQDGTYGRYENQRAASELLAAGGRPACDCRDGGPPMRRQLAALVSFSLTLTGAAACGSSGTPSKPSPGQPDKVAAAVIAIVDVAPVYLGKQKGFFSQRNIDLSLSTSQGGAAIVPAVLNGQVQIGFSNVTSLLLAASKGTPVEATPLQTILTGRPLLAASKGLPVKMVCNGVASTGVPDKDYSGAEVRGRH